MVSNAALVLDRIGVSFGPVRVLDEASLTVEAGEIVAVTGRSGSGKSTLLHIAGALAAPGAGRVTVAGTDLTGLRGARLAEMRRRTIGFVFQAFHLLPGVDVVDNVALPLVLDGVPRREARRRALASLASLDDEMASLADRRPAELSGGQLQRVAVARALVAGPAIVLADEPTGNLDRHSARTVLDALDAAVRARGAACALVTHDRVVASVADRVVAVQDGRVVDVPVTRRRASVAASA